ncbi:hypothetical protein [Thermomonospora sp. CIF 1]|nr:hypothetical protein [Thermomonospora sp. CIF 1]
MTARQLRRVKAVAPPLAPQASLKALPDRAGRWRDSAPGQELVEIISGID